MAPKEKASVTQSNPASGDWSKLTVAQLKDKLRARGLKVSGKKADLVTRLENAGANCPQKTGQDKPIKVSEKKTTATTEAAAKKSTKKKKRKKMRNGRIVNLKLFCAGEFWMEPSRVTWMQTWCAP